jgi:hypothetical protein
MLRAKLELLVMRVPFMELLYGGDLICKFLAVGTFYVDIIDRVAV